MMSGDGDYKVFQSRTYKKITLPDGKIVWVLPPDPTAAIVLCEFNEVIVEGDDSKELSDESQRLERDEKLKLEKWLNIPAYAKVKFDKDNEAQWKLIKNKPLRDSADKMKTVIEGIQEQTRNAFCIVSYHEWPSMIHKTLFYIGINADYVIVNLNEVLKGKSQQPEYTVIQDPLRPCSHLIPIIVGIPNNPEKHTKMEYNYHIQQAQNLFKILGYNVSPDRMVLMDKEAKEIAAARREGLHVTEVKDDANNHWERLAAKSFELRRGDRAVRLPQGAFGTLVDSVNGVLTKRTLQATVLGGMWVGFCAAGLADSLTNGAAITAFAGSTSLFITTCVTGGIAVCVLALVLYRRYKTGHFYFFSPPSPAAADSAPLVPTALPIPTRRRASSA